MKSRAEYDVLYKRSVEDPEGFWGDIAREFHWETPFPKGSVSSNMDTSKGPIHQTWFKARARRGHCAARPTPDRRFPNPRPAQGGRTNICYNSLDRNVKAGLGDRVAFYWEGNDEGAAETVTYSQLLARVCQLANYLTSQGVSKGDRVLVYLPMMLELPIAMLACARIGAMHSVVFGGFSAEAVAQRVVDCRPKIVITTGGVRRGAKPIPLKSVVDAALAHAAAEGVKVPTVLVAANGSAISNADTPWTGGRDVWWDEMVSEQPTEAPVAWVDAEEPLFMLYTSGSTGKPKGVVHTTGGYMVYAATTFKHAFDYRASDVYWCTADCGWITGHTYLTYGPLLQAASQVMFEGVPTFPDAGRLWRIVDKYAVSIFYTAPTLIRSLAQMGDSFLEGTSRASLRVLASVGEPINPAAWEWYHDKVGGGRCPIADTWWQTETGGHMIMPLPGAHTLKPGAATLPFFGIVPVLLEATTGVPVPAGEAGEGVLCIKSAWPGASRTLYEDHGRFEATYYAPYPGYYFTSDGASRDKDGYYWITGRVDDVINVSGHRIGTAEVESALVLHPSCAEAAVVGYDHAVKGQGIYAYVSLMRGTAPSEALRKELIASVRATIGAFAAPDIVHWAPGLPKTRSGKIMRRILRKIAAREHDQLGDISTLADPEVVQILIDSIGAAVPRFRVFARLSDSFAVAGK